MIDILYLKKIPLRDPAMRTGDLSNIKRHFRLVILLPKAFSSKYNSPAN